MIGADDACDDGAVPVAVEQRVVLSWRDQIRDRFYVQLFVVEYSGVDDCHAYPGSGGELVGGAVIRADGERLLVGDLEIGEDWIVGSYEIRVPLAPWRNDSGELRLEVAVPLEHLAQGGITLTGSGLSTDDGRISPISCKFGSNGALRIQVETRKHNLSFDTRYQVFD